MTVRCLECGDEIPLFGDRECSCSATRVEREEQELFEQLAALEHRQWVHWTQNLAEREDLPDHLIERWEANWCPYDELDEETKKHDRRWAAEVVEIIEGENSISATSSSDRETETQYLVTCDHCGLFESYKNERIANGHKNSHWNEYEHVATVEEREMYVSESEDKEEL